MNLYEAVIALESAKKPLTDEEIKDKAKAIFSGVKIDLTSALKEVLESESRNKVEADPSN